MTRKLIYSMGVSLDGFVAGPGGEIDWSVPDEELHRFHNRQTREIGAHLLGRRLYEVMTYWETAEENPSLPEHEVEFARIWKELPKVVFSKTLERVEGNARLVRGGVAEEVAKLKEQPGKDLAVGGAGLASALIELGLVDEYRLFVYPVVLGAGTPFFPPLDERVDLELVETRTFGSRVVYLRYRRVQRDDLARQRERLSWSNSSLHFQTLPPLFRLSGERMPAPSSCFRAGEESSADRTKAATPALPRRRDRGHE